MRLREWEAAAIVGLLLLVFRGAGSSRRLPRAVSWTDAEMSAFIEHVGPVGIPLPAVLLMFAAESGLDPRASSGVAWGINQAQGPLLKAAGWKLAPSAFGDVDVREQLPFVARMLRVQCGAIGYVPQTAPELYRANLSPQAAKERRDVIYKKEDGAAYDQNKGFDVERKGFITLRDLGRVLDRVESSGLYKRHRAQLERLQHGNGS